MSEKTTPADWLRVEVRQQDWVPGFGAFVDGGTAPQGEAHIVLNIGAHMAAVAMGDLPKEEVPYAIAETMMHEIMHALEAWAGVEFSEDRIDALLARYAQAAQEANSAR